MSIKRLTHLGILTAAALTIFVIETQLPPPAPMFPGIKYGLANIVSLYILFSPEFRDKRWSCAVMVLLARVILGTAITGRVSSVFMSLCGGILAILCMIITITLTKGRFLPLTSVIGGIFHNVGQLAAAYFVYNMVSVFTLLPYLAAGGAIAGLFTGVAFLFFLRKNKTINK